jgi:hypothetical protein
MKAELKTITPAMAQYILENGNTKNRPMNKHHVDSLAKEMSRGKWALNGDTICMNQGQLIDGQHRLAAVVKSGVSIQTFVVEGVPFDVFQTKDVGKRRFCRDTYLIRGEENPKALAAAINLLTRYYTKRVMTGAFGITQSDLDEMLEQHPKLRESVAIRLPKKSIIPRGVLHVSHYLFSQKDPVLANEFVEKLIQGADLIKGTPIHMLRERLVSNASAKAKLPDNYVFGLTVKAWNAVRLGLRIGVLKMLDNEAFPEVV